MPAVKLRKRSITFKNGGYIRLLPSTREQEHAKMAKNLRLAVADYIAQFDGQMAGFALIVWGVDSASCASIHNAETSPMNSSQIPSFAADRLRRRLSDSDANGIVRDYLGLPDEAS